MRALSPFPLAATALVFALGGGVIKAAQTELVSRQLPGPSTANGSSFGQPAVSADGNYVAFASEASDLVAQDTNAVEDVFVSNRSTGVIERISVRAAGQQANGPSDAPSMSADGRFVVFGSLASNLVAGDTNQSHDVFLRDRQMRVTERLSLSSSGAQLKEGAITGATISADGRYVAFASASPDVVPGDTNAVGDIFVRDRQSGITRRVSVSSSGGQANGRSAGAVLSGDGRFVAFVSYATNLVPGDTNGFADMFVHDLQTGTTERVNVSSSGVQANTFALDLSISADGRYVLFTSYANNLVPGDDTELLDGTDVFLRDRQLRTTTFASVNSAGQHPANQRCGAGTLSPDGRYVAFTSDADLAPGDSSSTVFVRDLQSGTTRRLSGIDYAAFLALSADNRTLAFTTSAFDVVPGDGNAVDDVFVHNLQSATTSLVSGSSLPSDTAGGISQLSRQSVSADGRFVVFQSGSLKLVPDDRNRIIDTFVRDRQTDTIERVNVDSSGNEADQFDDHVISNAGQFAISADGRYVAFASNATNLTPNSDGSSHIYVHDRQTRITEMVSVSTSGTVETFASTNPSISADGRYVAFTSLSTNLTPGVVCNDPQGACYDVYVRDRQSRTTTLVSGDLSGKATGTAYDPSISADGRYVAFEAFAPGMFAGDTNNTLDVFVRDRQSGALERVSVSSMGAQGNERSWMPTLSADARYVAFVSAASTLVASDNNGAPDVFVHDRQTRTTERITHAPIGSETGDIPFAPVLTRDGRAVAYAANWPGIVPGDGNGTWDIFLYDRQTKATQRVSVASNGAEADAQSMYASLSGDGRFVAFTSRASNLGFVDRNNNDDIFVRDRGGSGDTVGYSLTPASGINFGSRAIKTSSARRDFTVTNTGTQALPITSVAITGSNKSQFFMARHCGASVAVGASCTIGITFHPTVLGEKKASLRVIAGNSQTRERVLAGTGVAP